MSVRSDSRYAELVLPTLFLFLSVLFALVARGAGLNDPPPFWMATGAAMTGDVCDVEANVEARPLPGAVPLLGDGRVRMIFIRGVVEPIERDFFGRTQRIALVSVNDDGFLVQNSIEDVAAGGDLKDHVGDDVTVRGTILVKTDGQASLLVDAFEINGSPATPGRIGME